MAITVVSWNIAKKQEPWRQLVRMDADIALLQEATPPPEDLVPLRNATLPPAEGASPLDIGPREAWDSHSWNSDWWHGRWNALFDRWPMVVRLSDRVDVEWFRQISPVGDAKPDEIAVSGIGTIAAACVTPKDDSIGPFIAVSMYGRWMGPHSSVGSSWIYSDASAHRIISDISGFIGHVDTTRHRIIAAGDLNLFHGYGDNGNPYWEARYRSVFDRMNAVGLEFVGPQAPHGRQAETPPVGQPTDSLNVVTFTPNGQSPADAVNQLDYVFASRGFHESINVRALNEIDEWGSSDHCRLLINIADRQDVPSL